MEFPKPTNRQTAKEKQRSRYETLIFTRLVLLVAVPLLIVGLLCGILYYRSEFARGRAKLGEVAGNASMRMTSVFDGLRSYYLAALRNSSFTWMESCSEIPYSRYSDLRDAQELLRGGTYMDSYVVGYEYINLRYGWVLSNYGTFPLEQMKNQEEIRTFIDNQASQTATLYWVNRTGAAPRQTSSLWLNVSGQCLVARITSAKNGLVGMLLIHLDMEYLSELAGEWKSLGYDVVLLDANGETVTTTDTELAHALADAGDLSDGHLRIPGTISNYLVQGQAINFNGITCYAAYDEQQNLGSSVAAFWVSVLILLATVVVLLVCRWNSAFLYRPIRELLDQAYDVFGRREQNQDEFDYLTSSVTRAAQNQKDMQKLVQAQRRQLEQQFLLHILRSEASLEAIHSTMQEFGIQPFACYRLLVLSIVFEKQMTGSVREAVAQTVAQRLPAEICRRLFFCPVAVDATVVMVAGAENEETLAHNVETVYKGAAKVVSAGMGCRCVAGVSRVFTSPEQIASAWHEASEALRSRGAASEEMRQDLTYYTTAEDNHTEHGYDTLLENEIIAAMTACNKRETERLIGVFLERLEEKGVRGYERMFYLQRLVSTLLMVAENAGLSVSKVLSNHSDNLFAEISRIYSNDKMRTFLVEEVAVPVMDTAVAEHPVHRRAGKVSGRIIGGVGGGIGVRGGDGVVIPSNDGVIVGSIVPVWVRNGVVGAVLTGPGVISIVLGGLLAAGGEGQCQQQDRQKQGSARFHVRSSFAGSLRYPWRSMPQRSGFHAKFRLFFLEKRLGGVRTYGRCSADPALCAP